MATLEYVHNLGWAQVECKSSPTDFDEIGCDGLYISKITINKKHPYTWHIWVKAIIEWLF